MGYSKKYNKYRKRSFTMSDTKRREYAEQMADIEKFFDQSDWNISTMLDSCYKYYDEYKVRLSNHSADNSYHDLHEGILMINIKSSKLDFVKKIENEVDDILKFIDTLDLDKYRFINVNGNRVTCYFKGYKTKKEVFEIVGN